MSARFNGRIIFLGDLPPPVHGASNINKRFLELIRPEVVIDTGPKGTWANAGGDKRFSICKFFRFIFCFFIFLFSSLTHKKMIVYCSVNGGWGQIYNICYLLLARLLNKKVVLHHHSYSYINQHSFLFEILLVMCPASKTTHVLLAKCMENQFKNRYPLRKHNTTVISNIGLIEDANNIQPRQARSNMIVIGHMANLCEEKGLFLFLKLVSSLHEAGVAFEAVIAGPVDEKCGQILSEALAHQPALEYYGPLYGDKKARFLASLDVFVFPSKYRHEAEPLVVYEAAQYGCTVLGTEQGAMREAILKVGGMSHPYISDDDWVAWAGRQLLNFYKQDSRSKVLLAFTKERAANVGLLQNLFEQSYNPA